MAGKNNADHAVIVDLNKCIGCGLCQKDCVGGDIDIIDGKASPKGNGCILCGHCEAICPQDAVTITGFEDEVTEYDEQVRLDPRVLLDAIKTRRTIRNFKEDEVPEEIVDMIIEAGRLAPTGVNAQGTSYIILKDKKDACEKAAVETANKLLNIGKKFIPQLKSMKIDSNFFFKKAPLVIVIMGRDKVSASLAAENMAFMAEANGLGVLFSGFFTIVINNIGAIRKIIGIGKKPKAVTTLVIGYSAVKYKKSVRRNKAKVVKA